LFVALLLIGVGRYRRGEVLVASQLVRTAVGHLLTAWRLVHPVADDGRLDDLDPVRRFEQVYPAADRAIGVALAQEVEPAARALLSLAESGLTATRSFRLARPARYAAVSAGASAILAIEGHERLYSAARGAKRLRSGPGCIAPPPLSAGVWRRDDRLRDLTNDQKRDKGRC
jgi:hypothetical protein